MATALVIAVFCLGGFVLVSEAQTIDLRGGWETETYILKDGSEYQVKGRIFFTQTEWTVLMFIIDDQGTPRRGSGEGGSYTLEGDKLVFTHFFNLSAGEALGSFEARPTRYVAREPSDEDAPTEPCRVEGSGDSMTIHFPSGNRIRFRRTSKP
jgi:hypothetical protein